MDQLFARAPTTEDEEKLQADPKSRTAGLTSSSNVKDPVRPTGDSQTARLVLQA